MLKNIIAGLFFIISVVNAESIIAEEDDSFNDFMEVMEETTELANKNKIGADHAPGIISVLTHDDMKRVGVNNLYDALELLPNVEVVLNKTGTRNLVFRGIGAIDGSGKIKIMLNGVEQNSAASGIVHFDLPIDIIDRIEVIRGPASALYGEYAFSGIINIITKQDSNHVFGRYISDNSSTAGAIINYNDEDLSVNGIVTYSKGSGLEPKTTDSRGNVGNTETLRGDKSLLANIKYKDLKLNLAINKVDKGEMWGIAPAGVLPSNDGDENFKYDYKTVELSYKFNISKDLWIEPKIGYFRYDYWFDFTEMGTSNLPPLPMFSNIPTQILGEIKYDKKYVKVDSSYNLGMHNFIAGFEISNITEKKYYTKTTQPNGVIYSNDGNNDDRDLFAIYLHDNISLNESLMLSVGARYDKYNDTNNNKTTSYFSPRIALVYDLDSVNIFKAQYATSFKVPTFLEQSNGAKDAERNKMLEFQYIYKKENISLKTTLFYSVIDSLIYSPIPRVYANTVSDIVNYGSEIEYTQNFNNNFLISSNLSYVKAKYKDSGEDLALYAPYLANASLSYMPYSKFSSTVKVRYVGSKKREKEDTRDKFASTTSVDLVFRYLPLYAKNLDISFGIKNLTDEELKSPSKVYRSMGVVSQTYKDDFSVNNRYYFIGVDYRF